MGKKCVESTCRLQTGSRLQIAEIVKLYLSRYALVNNNFVQFPPQAKCTLRDQPRCLLSDVFFLSSEPKEARRLKTKVMKVYLFHSKCFPKISSSSVVPHDLANVARIYL